VTEPRNYVKYTFVKVDPAWRRRSSEERAADKREFAAACRDFGEDHYLRAYSLVGTRGDCDLMVRAISRTLEPIHELHVLLNQSGLMRYATIPHSYLAMTKESPYSDEPEKPLAPREGADSKYLIVYPMWKKREWYQLAPEERMRIMRDHIEVARRFSGIETNTAYSFGLDDQEFVVAFDTDRVPRPRARAARDRVERLHGVRDADLHLHRELHRARPRRSGRRARGACERSWSRRARGACERSWSRRGGQGAGVASFAASSSSSNEHSFTRGRPCSSPASRSARSTACQPA
jgi:chlorite dismutase